MANSGLKFTRNEENIKFIPSFCIPLLLISLFAITILTVVAIITFSTGDNIVAFIELGIVAILLIFGCVCDHLDWYHGVVYSFEGNKLIYSYHLDKRMLPTDNSLVKIKVKNIRKIDVKKNDIVIYGDIEKRTPMVKPKELSKITLKDIPEHHDQIMLQLDKLVVDFE